MPHDHHALERVARAADPIGSSLQTTMIWLHGFSAEQQVYAGFRRTFHVAGGPQEATIHLFADSRYLLWINGQYVARGPARFDPGFPEYDWIDVKPYLHDDNNIIAVLAHSYKAFGNYLRAMEHPPGLCVRLDWRDDCGAQVLHTDESWRVTSRTRFLPSPPSWGCIPEMVDARREDGDWTQPGYDDCHWDDAVPVDGDAWGKLVPRSIPPLRERPFAPRSILRQRIDGKTTSQSRAWSSALPVTMRAGDELIFDAGAMTQAWADLVFDADADSKLEIIYAQRYINDELLWSVAPHYASANCVDHTTDEAQRPALTCRYTTTAGSNRYTTFDTFGFRYACIRVLRGRIILERLTLVERLYPFERAGDFTCSDPAINELWKRSVLTAELCSEDGYVDCIMRERSQWISDAVFNAFPVTRVTQIRRPPDASVLYGDPGLLRRQLRQIAQSMGDDGRLKAHHPSDTWDMHSYIEDYACSWLRGLRQYVDLTNDAALAVELWPALVSQLGWFERRRGIRGLVSAREFIFLGNPEAYNVGEGTTLNAWVCAAYRDAAQLADKLDRSADARRFARCADEIEQAINDHLWDERSGSYGGMMTDDGPTPPTAHAAILALYFHLVPPNRHDAVLRFAMQTFETEFRYPATYPYVFEVLFRERNRELDRLVIDLIRRKWATVLAVEDAGTVFEGLQDSGEFCHNSGVSAASFMSNRILGVRLDGSLSNKRLLIEPRLGDLTHAAGTVVTEHGLVCVDWRRKGDVLTYRMNVPEDARATVTLPYVGAGAAGHINDLSLMADGEHLVFEVGPGLHEGHLTGVLN